MPKARLNTDRARNDLQAFRLADLFINELGWNNPSNRPALQLTDGDGSAWRAKVIAELSGFRVFEVTPVDPATNLPDAKNQAALWKHISAQSVENIAIYVDAKRTQSLWCWMKRDGKKLLPRRHVYIRDQPGDLFLSKLAALVIDLSELDEQGNLPITEAANRVRAALDVETVTKAFFKRFEEEHAVFLALVEGIEDPADRRWYASVLLNRLMFIWFLQKKLFLDGKAADYLPAKLAASAQAGPDAFYSHFLRDLFFEGFAKPSDKREPKGRLPLGDIPYLNGGLFLPHGIESRIEGDALFTGPYTRIRIPDRAFASIFRLFDAFSWNLNDVPGGDDREINPDVLGYIFEKYINQKEFGAYYTRPEITDYLCEQTIHQLVIDAATKHVARQQRLAQHVPNAPSAPTRVYESMGDVVMYADGSLCRALFNETLPRLSLLDPACGSGAFLIAALKTLLTIYTQILGRAEGLGETTILQWVEAEKAKHKGVPVAYWLKKKIITENLFGVDIMEEATEIAKLRLFLALVASAERRDQLEPLPNIEFNILPGNSLIGLLHVDPAKFDAGNPRSQNTSEAGGQERITLEHPPETDGLGLTVESKTAPTEKEKVGAHLATKRAEKYVELLQEKNRLVDLYKRSSYTFKDLSALKANIEAKKQQAREILDKLLLEQFTGLGIKFEGTVWDKTKSAEAKAKKRQLKIEDIQELHPFHWAYEFDEIIVNRGGFDAIITNPPWEIFKPNSKEFFRRFSSLVSKKKMQVEEFEEAKTDLLKDEEIQAAWLQYLSSYPHLSEWFRSAPQFRNQIGVVNGKKIGSDLNYYKIFLEQTVHLLKSDGRNGIVIPSGIYTDLGAMQLRVMLFDQSRITGLFGFENRKGVFDGVHRSFKFVVLTFEKGGSTEKFPVAFMRVGVEDLALFPSSNSLELSVSLIKRLSPGSLSLMEFKSDQDVEIASKMFCYPFLIGDADGWNIELYGEEFHMNRSVKLFHKEETPFPLYVGDCIWHFDSTYSKPKNWIIESEIRQDFEQKRRKRCGIEDQITIVCDYETYRIALRKISSNTNERTLVTSIIPKNALTGNSLATHFPHLHSKTTPNKLRYTFSELLCISALLNSFCADYIIRSKITTNLNTFYLEQLPVPHLTSHNTAFKPLVERAARLIGTTTEFDDLLKEVFGPDASHQTHGITEEGARLTLRAEIDAIVAQLYDLTEDEFAHILATFPLVPVSVRTRTLNTFRAMLPSPDDAAVARLIAAGENDKVEFKEAAAYSRQAGRKHPDMMTKVLREVTTFLNTSGGNVIIGVNDAGQVTGLADDFRHADPGKPSWDGYELHIRNALSDRLGIVPTQSCQITLHRVSGQEVCRIFVPAATKPVYLNNELLIRAGSSSRTLNERETKEYIFQHWRATV